MKYYVVADVHGYYTQLVDALTDAGFFDESEPHKLIMCGDLLDRGGEANRLIDFMMKLLSENKLIYILGNHEELFAQCLQEISRGDVYRIAGGLSHHYANKTWDSLLQISELSENEAVNNPNELVWCVMHSDFYKKLLSVCVDYFETANYIFTHGWIPCFCEGFGIIAQYKFDPDWRSADSEAWHRARWGNGIDLACRYGIKVPNKTVVCGHWHTSFGHSKIRGECSEWGADANFSPFYADGIIAIDACTAVSQRINCIIIED